MTLDLDALEAQRRACVPEATIFGATPELRDLVIKQVPALMQEIREGAARERTLALERNRARDNFQGRVVDWLRACFKSTTATNQMERGNRLLEETLELLQATGYPRERVAELTTYVYGRPVGEPHQEAGAVMVTLAAFCWTAGVDMREAGERELDRVSTPAMVERLRAKDASQVPGSALPGQLEEGERHE
jgi:hypothetical protein